LWNNCLLKRLTNYILNECSDIDEQQRRQLFPNTFHLRTDLVLNVLWSQETRDLIADFNKFSLPELHNILEKHSIPKVKRDEIKKQNLQQQIREKQISFSSYLSRFIKKSFSEILDSKEIEKLETIHQTFFQVTENPSIIHKGKVYVYHSLVQSNQFKSVTSPILSLSITNQSETDFEGKTFYIQESEEQYDLVVETLDGLKIYFIVNCTEKSLNNHHDYPFLCQHLEWWKFDPPKYDDKYCFVQVFQANSSSPIIYYLNHFMSFIKLDSFKKLQK
jgi:hypothetical protein